MQNFCHHSNRFSCLNRLRAGASTSGQHNDSSRRTAARRCQKHTFSLSAAPEGLDLIDTLFESVVKVEDGSSAEAPTHVLSSSRPAETALIAAAPVKAKQHAQQTGTIAASPAANSQRSKLLQRLQQQRTRSGPAVIDHTVPSKPTSTAPSRSSSSSGSSSSSKRVQRTSDLDNDTSTDDIINLQQLLQPRPDSAVNRVSDRSVSPINPWLLRQQQQRSRQKQKQQQKQVAKLLVVQQQKEQQQQAQEQEQQQYHQRQQLHAQLLQQQQQCTVQDTVNNAGKSRSSSTRRVQLQRKDASPQTQRSNQQPQQTDPARRQDSDPGSLITAPPFTVTPYGQQSPKQQQLLQQQLPLLPQLQRQQLQQSEVNLEGVVRSLRRSQIPSAQQQPAAAAAEAASNLRASSASESLDHTVSLSTDQQQGLPQLKHQQAPAAPGTSALLEQPSTPPPPPPAAAAAAAGTATESLHVCELGHMPLLVTGGTAAGDSVVWTQPAQILKPSDAAESIEQSSAAGAQISEPSRSQKRSSSSSRYRRGARSLQGIATGPKPDLPNPTAAAAAAPASMAAAKFSNNARASWSMADDVRSSSDSSRGAVDLVHMKQQLKTLNQHNWQQLAQQFLPGLYDPNWHSSFYTLALDVWAAALPTAAADSSSSSSSVTSTVAAAWAVPSLYCPEQCVWCSSLLALLDMLADADLARVEPAVQLLPTAVLHRLVLPVAKLLDDELHQELQQAEKRLGSSTSSKGSTGTAGDSSIGWPLLSSTAAAVTATKPVIGPAPWLQEQQRHGQQSADDLLDNKLNSSSSSSSSVVVTGDRQYTELGLDSNKSTPAAAAAASEDAVPPGAVCLLSTLLELRQLQGLYPGVELSALAHVAQLHGVWK